MPWDVHKLGNVWVVTKKEDGKVVGKHPTREKAMRHMRALYANVKT